MSAFDDEFGLFGDDEQEVERTSTLGARKIASDETIIDDIEPEDERPPRRRNGERMEHGDPGRRQSGGRFGKPDRLRTRRAPVDAEASQRRATDLLGFLAKKMVAKPDEVAVEFFPPEGHELPAIELAVDPEDIGKVIGRSGRVAQALRTVVRAAAESKVSIDIFDTDEIAQASAAEAQDGGA